MSISEGVTLQLVQKLAKVGDFTQAKALLQKELRKGSTSALDNAMAIVLLQLGEIELAEYHAERGASVNGANPKCISTYGNILTMRRKHEKALAAFERSLAMEPKYLPALLGLANTQRSLNRLSDSEITLRRATAIQRDPAVEGTLAAVLVALGRCEEGWDVAKAAAERFPGDVTAATSYANAANFAPVIAAADALEAQRHYGRLVERQSPLPPRPAIRDANPERPLRIGFVSQDLRRHSVSYFFEPLLRHLDRSMFEPLCYSASSKVDEFTERLRGLSSVFRTIVDDSDAKAAGVIRSDRVDVLVDLSGHTRDHRLELFHHRPAPVQVTYLGYPNITGLSAIDARIVDEHTDPMTASERSQGPERLVRIDPPFVCYTPAAGAPDVRERPAGRPVTFGSFNAIAKLNAPLLESWARILRSVPGARLLLKGQAFGDAVARDDMARRLHAAGADVARVELRADAPKVEDHLAMYHDVDLALDAFPYNGTTTTCEAMWQGVPVVTFAGDRHAARVGAALLRAVGCPELVSSDVAGYERIAVELASSPQRLASYRSTLRDRLRTSPLCDGPRLANAFGAAIRGLWRTACENPAQL